MERMRREENTGVETGQEVARLPSREERYGEEKLRVCPNCGAVVEFSYSEPVEIVRGSGWYGGADSRAYHHMCEMCGADDPACECYRCRGEDANYDPHPCRAIEDLVFRRGDKE